MKLLTITRSQTETLDIHLEDLRFHLHFADDATPEQAGGPGSLHIVCCVPGLPPLHSVVAADDPLALEFKGRALASLDEVE